MNRKINFIYGNICSGILLKTIADSKSNPTFTKQELNIKSSINFQSTKINSLINNVQRKLRKKLIVFWYLESGNGMGFKFF